MKKSINIPALRGLKYAFLTIARPTAQWLIAPHPLLLLTIVTSALAHYGLLRLFSEKTRATLIDAASHLQSGYALTLPIMIITYICAVITRRLMFHGGAKLEQHHDDEIDDRWPQQTIRYLQGVHWFIVGTGCFYVWLAKIIVSVTKWTCIGIIKTVDFILVTLPVFLGSEVILPLAKYTHSTIKRAFAFYTAIALCIIGRDAFIHPDHAFSREVIIYVSSALSFYAIIKLYSLLDQLGKKQIS